MQRGLARMGVWKGDMVGCGQVGERDEQKKERVARASRAVFTSIYQPPRQATISAP